MPFPISISSIFTFSFCRSTKIEIHFNDDDKLNIVSIKNKIDDLIQVINSDSFYSIYYNTLERIRNTYSKIFGFIEVPIEKYERLITDKDYFNSYIKKTSYGSKN